MPHLQEADIKRKNNREQTGVSKRKSNRPTQLRRATTILNETITYAGVIYMIIGWTVGRIIGIMLISTLEKRNNKKERDNGQILEQGKY